MNKIIVLDFGIFMHRSIFSYVNNPQIPPTYTCLSMMLGCLKRIGIEPDDTVFIATDKGHSWRKEIDVNYKANRKEARERLPINWDKHFKEMDILLEKIDMATDWHILSEMTFEADDWMAVISRHYPDKEIVLVTYDKDLEQMFIYPNVRIFSPMTKKYKIPPKNFNINKFIDQKIAKETTDNLVNPIISQEDYEKRNTIINLLELPAFVENTIVNRLNNLPEKEMNIELIPFNNIRQNFMSIYNSDKIITYDKCQKQLERKMRLKARPKSKCCNALAVIRGRTTKYYVCTKCKKACDTK